MKAKLQLERARQQRQQQRWDELSYRLWRLGIKRTASTAGKVATPCTGRIIRSFETTIKVR